jgi:hypothetical protein
MPTGFSMAPKSPQQKRVGKKLSMLSSSSFQNPPSRASLCFSNAESSIENFSINEEKEKYIENYIMNKDPEFYILE